MKELKPIMATRDVVGPFADFPLQMVLVIAKNALRWLWNPIHFPEKSTFCIFKLKFSKNFKIFKKFWKMFLAISFCFLTCCLPPPPWPSPLQHLCYRYLLKGTIYPDIFWVKIFATVICFQAKHELLCDETSYIFRKMY